MLSESNWNMKSHGTMNTTGRRTTWSLLLHLCETQPIVEFWIFWLGGIYPVKMVEKMLVLQYFVIENFRQQFLLKNKFFIKKLESLFVFCLKVSGRFV